MKVTSKPRSNQSDNNSRFSRYGRKLTAGNHPFAVLEAREDEVDVDVDGATEKRGRITLVLETPGNKAEDAPEGPVKIDYKAIQGTWQMDNLIETFFPEQVGKEFDLHSGKLIGATAVGQVKLLPPKARTDGTGMLPEKAVIQRFVSGKLAADEDAF